MSEGWISLHRNLLNNSLWLSEKFTKAQAWVDMLLLANHKSGFIFVRGNKVEVHRGQLGRSKDKLAERWGWSPKKVENFLIFLEKEGQISRKKSHILSVVTIENYDLYQDKGITEEGQKRDRRKTEEGQKFSDRNNNKSDRQKKSNKYNNNNDLSSCERGVSAEGEGQKRDRRKTEEGQKNTNNNENNKNNPPISPRGDFFDDSKFLEFLEFFEKLTGRVLGDKSKADIFTKWIKLDNPDGEFEFITERLEKKHENGERLNLKLFLHQKQWKIADMNLNA